MVQFLDLPLELLPIILSHLLKPHHLATSSLVSKSFHTYATPKLYKRASIFSWHRQGKAKVTNAFSSNIRDLHGNRFYVGHTTLRHSFALSASRQIRRSAWFVAISDIEYCNLMLSLFHVPYFRNPGFSEGVYNCWR